jgi:8-oxo-dGTP pyrophosphatase MutT (NUDIX family)
VYAWIITRDNQVIIVSKADEIWQLPGGKPAAGETHLQTALREVEEETGIRLAEIHHVCSRIGFNTVHDRQQDITYLQIRLRFVLDILAAELSLKITEPDADPEDGKIKYVMTCPLDLVTRYIPWLEGSEEFKCAVVGTR